MRLIATLGIVALAVTPVVASVQAPAQAPAPAAPAPSKPAFSTSETTIGALMANPAAKDVVVKHIPMMAEAGDNPQAAGMTLKDAQQYVPDLNDKALAAIDADLAKIPAPAK